MKVCFCCKLPKENSEFSKETRRADGLSSKCKPCHKTNRENRAVKIKEERKRYRINNPEKLRADQLKYKYGISTEDFENLLVGQSGKCRICEGFMVEPHVDHCHLTGKIRGLLCQLCNVGLGVFKDSTKNLRAAITYLENQP